MGIGSVGWFIAIAVVLFFVFLAIEGIGERIQRRSGPARRPDEPPDAQ